MNKYIIISQMAPVKCKNKLKNMGYTIFESGCLKCVDPFVAHHPDMQIVRISDSEFLCAPELYNHYYPLFQKTGFILYTGHSNPVSPYPGDVLYNIAVSGKYALHNLKYTDSEYLHKSNYVNINIAQGYSKCNICFVNSSSIITSDKGIAQKASFAGMDVLLISPGYIELPGYNYGFIGGCSGLIDSDVLAFCGDITLHHDYERIYDFCHKRCVNILSLSDEMLMDIGTIISLG